MAETQEYIPEEEIAVQSDPTLEIEPFLEPQKPTRLEIERMPDAQLASLVIENNPDAWDLLWSRLDQDVQNLAKRFYKAYPYVGYEVEDYISEAMIFAKQVVPKWSNNHTSGLSLTTLNPEITN